MVRRLAVVVILGLLFRAGIRGTTACPRGFCYDCGADRPRQELLAVAGKLDTGDDIGTRYLCSWIVGGLVSQKSLRLGVVTWEKRWCWERVVLLRSMNNLAIHYSQARRRAEALQLREEVLKLHKSKLDEDHPDTLMSIHNLAIRYSEAGQWVDAL